MLIRIELTSRKLPLNPPVRRAPRNKAKAKRLDPAPAAAMASGSSTRYSFTFCTYEDPRELIVRATTTRARTRDSSESSIHWEQQLTLLAAFRNLYSVLVHDRRASGRRHLRRISGSRARSGWRGICSLRYLARRDLVRVSRWYRGQSRFGSGL